jgi:hypothetical protein
MEFNEQEKALITEITGQAQKFVTDKLNGMINTHQEFASKDGSPERINQNGN